MQDGSMQCLSSGHYIGILQCVLRGGHYIGISQCVLSGGHYIGISQCVFEWYRFSRGIRYHQNVIQENGNHFITSPPTPLTHLYTHVVYKVHTCMK